MSLDAISYETRFRVMENLLIDVLTDFTQKLSQLCETEVFFLAQSQALGRRVAGSPGLCQSFLNGQLSPDGTEVDLSSQLEEETLNCSPETVSIETPVVENAAATIVIAAPPQPLHSPRRISPASRKRASCTSIDEGRSQVALKVSKLSTAVKMEAIEDAVNSENISRIMMEETEEGAVGKMLDAFLTSSSKAEAIRQSSDPSIFAKSSVMYKLFSSLIWDYSKECAKVLPFDDKCKPLLTSFAFDILWNYFPAFEFYDNSPSINSGGCFRSPRGFFKNMFCNRLKDQTTRKKR